MRAVGLTCLRQITSRTQFLNGTDLLPGDILESTKRSRRNSWRVVPSIATRPLTESSAAEMTSDPVGNITRGPSQAPLAS
jgi:hypothetical protein